VKYVLIFHGGADVLRKKVTANSNRPNGMSREVQLYLEARCVDGAEIHLSARLPPAMFAVFISDSNLPPLLLLPKSNLVNVRRFKNTHTCLFCVSRAGPEYEKVCQ
jgi:hypothetical protein